MDKVLAVNSGSSSLKFKLFEMPSEAVIASGLIERIAIPGSQTTIKYGNGKVYKHQGTVKNHGEAVNNLMELLISLGIIEKYSEITGVGHRVVAGGEYFSKSVVVTDEVIRKIKNITELAPLHNPANLIGIQAFKEMLPDACSVVVFDTAFHQTMPEENFLYSVPYEWYEKLGVRRYGAHGTSHRYVAGEAAKLMGRPLKDLKLVTCHFGAGSSLCAIKNGKSFDTSMGFTPLTGVTMATRSGDVDVSMIAFVMDKLGINSISEMIYTLNKESGLAGISGVSSDMRDILSVSHAKHRARLAIDIFVKDIVKYIGQYYFEMGGIDGIVFTAGIGENSAVIRKMIMERLSFMNITIDNEKNEEQDGATVISGEDSAITMMKIPTNEELMIARDVMELKNKKNKC
ncbi:acetate/propionate family kinase [Ligilactobacillus ruminis]|uniref:acetate/propionate family kinase n=1 Tax=Ligilactobacillus ruminis TaxID=1623 RepID=UPI0012B044F5|nr:acetate kinase [Ligilactobacillus ruminis]MSA47349.1 acetate/propionate family kinase [Ligilactobacillus ruminis]